MSEMHANAVQGVPEKLGNDASRYRECTRWLEAVAYLGILFPGEVQQIQLRTERKGVWGR